MAKIKAVYSAKKYKNGNPGVSAFGQNVHDAINGNVHFATPSPSLIVIQSTIDDFNTAYQARVTSQGGKVNVAAVKTARKILDRMLSNVCAYVNNIANQNEATEGAVIDSSGFPRKSVNGPVGRLPAPNKLRAKIAKTIPSGSFWALWEKVPGASSYFVGITGDGNYSHSFTTTKAKAIVEGLTPGAFIT